MEQGYTHASEEDELYRRLIEVSRMREVYSNGKVSMVTCMMSGCHMHIYMKLGKNEEGDVGSYIYILYILYVYTCTSLNACLH